MPKYTDHIDELDAFYQNSFENGELQPPADMWERIEASYEKQKPPSRKPFYFSWQFWTIAAAVLLALLLLLWLIKSPEKTSGTDQPENVIENNIPSGNNTNSGTNMNPDKTDVPNNLQNSGINGQNKHAVNQDPDNNAGTPITNSTVDSSASSTTNVIPDPKVETVDTTSKKEEKKKLRFKEKHREALKDSTRPLFIPEKNR